jgi:uncharacterized protein (TIGR02246 family)
MTRSLAGVALMGVLAGMGCASANAPADAASEILRVDAEWSQAAQARDLDRIVSYWAEDAIVYPPGAPALVGKAAIREYVAKSLQTPDFAISRKSDRAVVSKSGDMAYATGRNRVTFLGPDGKSVTVDGKAVTVWRKQTDGSWKCVIDIWNDLSTP